MKKLIIAFAIIFALISGAGSAELLSDQCQVREVIISDTADGSQNEVKMTYIVYCGAGSDYQGQVTKMVVALPVTGLRSLSAEDSFGTLEVLEGPEYISSEVKDDKTLVGVIFRKGLLITDEDTAYSITIKFKTSSLTSKSESVYTLTPGKLVANPKVTIVTENGITETTMQVQAYDFILDFEDSVSMQEIKPAACQLSAGTVTCNNMGADDLENAEVKWEQTGLGSGLRNLVGKYTENVLPKLTDLFGRLVSKTSEVIDR